MVKKSGLDMASICAVIGALVLAVVLVGFGVLMKNSNWFVVEAVHDLGTESVQTTEAVTVTVSESVPSITVPETTVAEIDVNYIYEKVTGDETEITVLGDVAVDDEKITRLNQVLAGYSKRIGFKAVTIDGAKGLSYNSGGEFFMASAVKAPYLFYAYMQMDMGNGSPDEKMKYTGNFYHKGTGIIRYMPVGTTFTLEEIMRHAMQKSDNVAYNMCIGRWGKDGYNRLMTELGCESLVLDAGTQWVFEGKVDELLIIWEEIYKFMNSGSEGARLLYDSCTFLGQTVDFNFMKDVLPDTTVSQKYGWSDGGYGNGAIVYGQNQTYIIVVFMDSSGTAKDQQVYREVVRFVDEFLDKK